ncbi:MAG TPA: glycosyltransferase family 4 protein [Lacipirellulaceae bacterium]|nr:glycosyltransferase family 4 protein [Lacipirellulaceae bacterium]
MSFDRFMPSSVKIHKIAFVGDYLPRKCGIATFTHDLRNAVGGQYPAIECAVVPVDDIEGGYDYPAEVRFEIQEQELASYRRAADFLNFANVDVVCLQHEFGIYGGPAGGHVLALMRDLRVPVVSTLHTVLQSPNDDQRRVMQRLCELSARVVVMAERSKTFLLDVYKVPAEKIDLIPHGIPDMPFVDSSFFKDQFDVEGKFVALTFGLLSPNKGIESVLQAMPKVIAESPDFVYIVLGATHPNLVREHGEIYRLSLERLAQQLGIQKHVIFYNRFVELRELTEFIGAADIYITPYLNEAQAVSGTLAYAYGCGKAVVSTPYWHAAELLADDRGVLVPFGDSEAIARAVIDLANDDTRRTGMRKRAYLVGREMIWSHVAHMYMESFQRARHGRAATLAKTRAVRTLDAEPPQFPQMRFEHLLQMTDSTGVIQHATYSIPNFEEGYCLDDNARGLVLTVLLEELGVDSIDIQRAGTSYAAFLNFAFDNSTGRFRNFLSFDRHWLEDAGSDDSVGRAAWAVGACIGRTKRRAFHAWAAQLFEPAVNAVVETTSPRAWAFALIGIHEYFRRMSGDRLMNQHRDTLTARLIELFEKNATDNWPWFEPTATYDNAKIPHALILSGRWTNNQQAIDIGLRSLRWLADVQRAPAGHFRPIGSEGFFALGQPPAQFDQQPLEAQSMVSAAIEAFRATNDPFWMTQARMAFEWFTGRNDLGVPVCEPSSGGCCDGLHADRVNQNQGAESTLAYLQALAEMQLLEI